ncbi:unnamed protein product [Paramecium octaurelia]|uniref:Uncharacterized protein n=1 Tax=Paramecium octaurelia TaxID=43137 RepID=A0A8S1VHU0_PAROT|nr:unnamed protein product [Paramecium octaurelia]
MGICSSKSSEKELQKALYLQRLREFKAKFKQSTAEVIQFSLDFKNDEENDLSKVKYVISENPIVKRRSKPQNEICNVSLTAKENEN